MCFSFIRTFIDGNAVREAAQLAEESSEHCQISMSQAANMPGRGTQACNLRSLLKLQPGSL
jgi:hypothetical protein